MNQLDAMRVFLRVTELASFTQAAASLGLPKASVSAAIQQLETELGTRLLHRTTRKVQATQDGQVYYQRCKDLLADVDDLQTLFQSGAALTGRIRIDMPSGLAANSVVPRLPEFFAAHPGIDIELSSTDRRVDPIREGFDCVIRVGELGDTSLIARLIGHFPIINCVSRDYAAQHGVPTSLAALAGHRLVHYVQSLGGATPGFEYVDADGVERSVPMPGALVVNNAPAYTAACLAGLGLIQVPEPAMRPFLAAGTLVEVLHSHRCAPMPISLLYANRRHLPRRVRVFMDWVTDIIHATLA
jgi:DNA-binding transcriptional LysR family regulator